MNIYLDESGNLTPSGGSYFIVGSYTVENPDKIAKSFRKWQKAKFPTKLKDNAEVKFVDRGLADSLRLKTLQFISDQDIKIYYTYLKKKNIPSEYFHNGKLHKSGLLYTNVVALTIEQYIPLTDSSLYLFRDQRSLKAMTIEQFNETLHTLIVPKLSPSTHFQVTALDSTSSVPIQIADWVCGAFARYHDGHPMGREFFTILNKNVVASKELFVNC